MLVAGCADGHVFDPFVLYNGVLLPDKWYDGTENRIHVDRNEGGTMDPNMFLSYVRQVVIPHFKNIGGP